jgi:hypothetical protein
MHVLVILSFAGPCRPIGRIRLWGPSIKRGDDPDRSQVFVGPQRRDARNVAQVEHVSRSERPDDPLRHRDGQRVRVRRQRLLGSNQRRHPHPAGGHGDLHYFRIATERDTLNITSTHGEGDPPQTASDFFDFLDETDVSLRNVRYGMLALGDSGYENFCEAGKRLDRRLAELGATRLTPRKDVDVGEMKSAREWVDDFVRIVATSAAATRA